MKPDGAGGAFLYIAYFFPPMGGAGVQRTVKFCRYLPEHGWTPIVLTVRHRDYWIDDPTLASEVPPSVTIVRTPSPDGLRLLGAFRRRPAEGARSGGRTRRARALSGWVLVPDAYRPWKPFALRAARRILRERPVRAIVSTSSPDTAHVIARDLARETALPWIADFRDPWTRRIAYAPPTRLHDRWHVAMEASVLEEASHVVVTTDETRDDFLSRSPHLTAERISVIPNGVDPADFPGADPAPDAARFTLSFVGQLSSGRTVDPLLPVLEAFFAAVPGARAHTRVRFVGPVERENVARVARAGLDDVIVFEPSRPHREAVRVLLDGHVALLVEHPGARAGLIAQGKLYEALYSTRPVLALVPPGAVRRLLAHIGGGGGGRGGRGRDRRVPLRRVRGVAGRPDAARCTPDRLRPFHRRALARQLAEVLTRATSAV